MRSTSWPAHPVPRITPYIHTNLYNICVCIVTSIYSLSTRENSKLGWERYGLEPMKNLRAATDWCERLVNRNNRLSVPCHVYWSTTGEGLFVEKKIVHKITIIVQLSNVLLVHSNSDDHVCGYAWKYVNVVELKI